MRKNDRFSKRSFYRLLYARFYHHDQIRPLLNNSQKILHHIRHPKLVFKNFKKLVLEMKKDGVKFTLIQKFGRKSYKNWKKLYNQEFLEKDFEAKNQFSVIFFFSKPFSRTYPPSLFKLAHWEKIYIVPSMQMDKDCISYLKSYKILSPYEICEFNSPEQVYSIISKIKTPFVVISHQEQQLSRMYLSYISTYVHRYPEGKLFYSDSDHIFRRRKIRPYFRPGFNKELLLNKNYIGQTYCIQTSLLKRGPLTIKGLCERNFDLILLSLCVPLPHSSIVRIPRVLYHQLSFHRNKEKERSNYALTVTQVLKENYPINPPHIKWTLNGIQYIDWPLPKSHYPLVSVIIPTKDQVSYLKVCLEGLLNKTSYHNIEVLIIDNKSTDTKTQQFFEEITLQDKRVKIHSYPHPFNFSSINNFGVKMAKGELILMLNNDTKVIHPNWLTEMVKQASRPSIGAVGPKLLYPNKKLQHAGIIIGLGGVAGHPYKLKSHNHPGHYNMALYDQEISAVTAACLLVRKKVYMEVEGLDEKNLTVAFNDVDFCLKILKAGYKNLYLPRLKLFHFESISRGSDLDPKKVKRFSSECDFMKQKWNQYIKDDPYYNPNLSLNHFNYQLAFPPRGQ